MMRALDHVRLLRRWRGSQSGAVALEFAIVAAVFIIVSVGLLEFGRVLQVRNELAHAIDRGAREVAIAIANSQNPTDEEIKTKVKAAVKAGLTRYDEDRLKISVQEETVNSLPYVAISLNYSLEIFIPGFAGTLAIGMPPRRVPRV